MASGRDFVTTKHQIIFIWVKSAFFLPKTYLKQIFSSKKMSLDEKSKKKF